MIDYLEQRILQYQCFELPGQPIFAHAGTSDLIFDLWEEVRRLRADLDEERQRRFEGNRCASEEHAEEVHELRAELDAMREAMRQALEALDECMYASTEKAKRLVSDAIGALRERLK